MNPVPPPLQLPPSGVIRGCWQLSEGHGGGWNRERAFAALDAAAAARPLVLDCADIYTGVERTIGDWLARRPDIADDVVVHTKFVPDLNVLSTIDRDHVRRVVLRSRDRLGVNVLELVQFAWWDLAQPKWVQTAEWLAELREEGIIRNLGVTNFDPASLGALLDAGIPVVSSQVQFSLLDRRPLKGLMVDGRRVRLSPCDVARLEETVPATVKGEVFEVERDREGPHGRIMRYNLNRGDGAGGTA